MLYNLLYPLADRVAWFNLFHYITFRTIYALITALVLCWLAAPRFIRWLSASQQQPIRSDGPATHHAKQGTPTMGGLLIIVAVLLSTLLWADLTNGFVWLALLVLVGFGAIGLYDDYRKVVLHSPEGISARQKMGAQLVIALVVGLILTAMSEPLVVIPFVKQPWNIGWWYLPFVVLVLVGASNAVNLTDGLDGLAVAPTFMVATALAVVVYLTGHARFADYLLIPHVAGVGELTIFCGAMVGACLGFLWFNTYPAQVFMGDVGALALGAALGFVACAAHQQLLLAIAGGLFVLEAISVMVQVASFKLTGRRVFRMAPIHHHFELKGWPEPKVIVRFWIIAILLALFALSTLKIR
ncbi:MAG: phospho-N-acetylmuramoyl-pentapeptide-transferase [Zetaproteobacteria bacterium]|nr:MAG: phospho-N-acetylmuramoyl-pentapeptide-transferase [Zetaproteobacteria bacterium]